MMAKINDQEIEVSASPIILFCDKEYSKQVFVFYCNGREYYGAISKQGKLVVSTKEPIVGK